MSKPKHIKGLIEDATERLFFTVRQQDVDCAVKLDPFHCAAANAIRREYKAASVCVMLTTTYVNVGTKKEPHWMRYKTPPVIGREIHAFDKGASFEPGTYQMPPHPPASTLESFKATNRSRSRDRSNEGSKPPKFRNMTVKSRHRVKLQEV